MDIIETLANRTHSPRGKYAATDDTYQELLLRIPAEQRPAASHPVQRHFFIRWSAAACVLLVAGLFIAIAGIVYLHFYASPSAPAIADSKPSDTEEIRTLFYEDTPLSAIVSELSETYHVSIEIQNTELLDYRLTATFTSDEPVEEILNILAEAGGFEIQKTDDGFVIQ